MRNTNHEIFGSHADAKRFYATRGIVFSDATTIVSYRGRDWTGPFASTDDGNQIVLGTRMGLTVAIETVDPFNGTW